VGADYRQQQEQDEHQQYLEQCNRHANNITETIMKFEKAVRKRAKLRLALTGPSGSGKTLSALLLAKGIGGKIAVLDTERDSASLYASPITLPDRSTIYPPDFDTLSLSAPYSPERYIEAIRLAEKEGYATMVIDSITHEWSGVGGCLELVDEIARARYRGNSWSAWNDVTPRHRALLDAILQSSMHIIVTLRSKTETAQQENQNGKKSVVKLGMKAEQRDGFEYEMTMVMDLSHDGHFATATKDRTGLFMGRDPAVLTEETGKALLNWLETGVEAQPVKEPQQTTETKKIDESEIADHKAAIESAESLNALFRAFSAAYRAATTVKDSHALAIFTDAKEARKATLEQYGEQA
jgi:hypothetical protein